VKVFEANIKDIKPYENNPRVIPQEAVDRVANSIKEFGMQQPIVVDRDMVIIVGHTRFKACEALGMGTVPCVIADMLTEEQVRAYRLADNKTNEFTSWDDELLDFELGELFRDNFDMEQFGFDMGLDDEDDEDKTIIEDEVDFDAPSITQPGDVWQLGNHTLMCGDSTRAADVETLMGGGNGRHAGY
jgi:ParB-like chromosome segregation protein Spo0J